MVVLGLVCLVLAGGLRGIWLLAHRLTQGANLNVRVGQFSSLAISDGDDFAQSVIVVGSFWAADSRAHVVFVREFRHGLGDRSSLYSNSESFGVLRNPGVLLKPKSLLWVHEAFSATGSFEFRAKRLVYLLAARSKRFPVCSQGTADIVREVGRRNALCAFTTQEVRFRRLCAVFVDFVEAAGELGVKHVHTSGVDHDGSPLAPDAGLLEVDGAVHIRPSQSDEFFGQGLVGYPHALVVDNIVILHAAKIAVIF